MKWLKKGSLILALTLLFALLWNVRVLVNVARPQVIAFVPSVGASSVPPGDSLHYPRLGIGAPVKGGAGTSPLQTGDWEQIGKALTEGVALSYQEGEFAEASLVFVTGHSSDRYPHAYSSVFAGLAQAKEGDSFKLTLNGEEFVYQVKESRLLRPEDTEAFASLRPESDGVQRAVLVTCWPLLTTQKRLVVIGERVR